jgi:hypothetical protein
LDLHLENSMTYICNLWILIICMDWGARWCRHRLFCLSDILLATWMLLQFN